MGQTLVPDAVWKAGEPEPPKLIERTGAAEPSWGSAQAFWRQWFRENTAMPPLSQFPPESPFDASRLTWSQPTTTGSTNTEISWDRTKIQSR